MTRHHHPSTYGIPQPDDPADSLIPVLYPIVSNGVAITDVPPYARRLISDLRNARLKFNFSVTDDTVIVVASIDGERMTARWSGKDISTPPSGRRTWYFDSGTLGERTGLNLFHLRTAVTHSTPHIDTLPPIEENP